MAERGDALEAPSVLRGRPQRSAGATADNTTNRLRASIVDLTFLIWAIAAPAAFGVRMLNSDGDLLRHIAMGEHLLRHGWITEDLFSFTRAGEPFLTYEWLSQISYALFHRLGGIPAVAICAGLLIATALALIVLFMRRQGVDPLLAYLAGVTAALLGAVHWLARPHLFSFVGVALLLFVLHARDRRVLWAVFPLFAVWANLHPGFVMGLVLLGAFMVGDLLEALWSRSDPQARAHWIGRAKYHALAGGIGAIATLMTPHGPGLHAHIFGLLGDSYLIDITSEFMSPNFHSVHGKLFAFVLMGVMAGLTLRNRRIQFPHLLVLLMMVYGSLFAQRNIPLFGMVVVPLLMLELDGPWRSFSLRGLSHVRGVFQRGEVLGRPGLWIAPISLALLMLAANDGRVAGVRAVRAELEPLRFPLAAVEWAREEGISGRTYHELTWGGYILYAWPGHRIFIDGLTDFFGEELVRDYLRILLLERDWDREMESYDIELVLLPPDYQLVYALERDGWRELYRDDTAVLLERPEGWPSARPIRGPAAEAATATP